MKITYKGIGSDLKNILFKEFEKNILKYGFKEK